MEEENEKRMMAVPQETEPENKPQNRILRTCGWFLNWGLDFMIVLTVVGFVSSIITGFDGNAALIIWLLISLFTAPVLALLIRKKFGHSLGEWLFCLEFRNGGFGDLFLKRLIIPGRKFQHCRIHDFSWMRFSAGCALLILLIVCCFC